MCEDFQHQIVALAIASGKPIAHGVNSKRHIRGKSTFLCSAHAEISLINKMGDRIRGCRVYVYRFNNSSAPDARNPKNARPCLLCQHELRVAGVNRVVYLDDSGEVQFLKNKEMALLTASPAIITSMFLSTTAQNGGGVRFRATDYLST